VLDAALGFLRDRVRPHAEQIDSDREAMRNAFDGMRELKLLSLRRSEKYGGPNVSEREFRAFQEEIARASGALAFLQTQHQSAVSLLGKHANEAIRAEYLPKMDSSLCVGLGFSQLRRSGEPICKAQPTVGGYLLHGEVPWITGLGFFDEYIVGASLPDGQAVFGLVPFREVEGQILSKPMRLTAMEAATTVAGHLSNYFLPEEKVAFKKAPGWIRANDAFNVTLQGHFAVGCAMAGIDIVLENARKKKLSFLENSAVALTHELSILRQELVDSQSDFAEETLSKRLQLRGRVIELMMRCAHAAVVSSSGASNVKGHPAGRVLREAIVFSVSAQTGAIMEATMKLLVRNSEQTA
jgi:alkylation response protein AidB-like acyl-CoA dehydrogenase